MAEALVSAGEAAPPAEGALPAFRVLFVSGVAGGTRRCRVTQPMEQLALAGIPMADFPDLIRRHSPHHLHLRAIEHHILDGTAQDVHKVVSPLAMAPAAPRDARAIFAGMGDRLATADQARRLWDHWERPDLCWFPGSHVGYLWSDKAWRFVDECVRSRGLAVEATPAVAAPTVANSTQ